LVTGDSIVKHVRMDNKSVFNCAEGGATIIKIYEQLELNNFRFFSKIIIHVGFNSLNVGLESMKQQFDALIKWVSHV
jgi:hypothetical protein